jgi:hypothetical protein
VIGLQEMGSSSNREAWGAAFLRHLNGGPDGHAAGAGFGVSSWGAGGATAAAAGAAAGAEASQQQQRPRYLLVEHVWMWEMGLWVFVRTDSAPHITSVSKADLPTGLAVAKAITGVQLGNKGAIGIALRWRDTALGFLNCHLPARPDLVRLAKRETDYKAIVRRLRLNTALARTGLDWVHQVSPATRVKRQARGPA